ncbi:MAG: M56 family metallopeptidase [Acetatifactor sp.]
MTRIFFDVLELNLGITVVILILGLLSGKLRKRYGAGCMKWLWMLLAVRLLIPYNFSLPNTEIRLFDSPDFAQEESRDRSGELGIDEKDNGLQREGTDTQIVPANPKPPVTADDQANGSEANASPAVGDPINMMTPSEQVLENVTGNPDAEETHPGQMEKVEQSKQKCTVSVLLASIWLIGFGAAGLYHVVWRCCFFLDCRRHLREVPVEETRRQIDALQMKLIGRVLPVFTSKRVTSPMLIGVVHPKMVLPVSMDQWKDEELELIVAHELTHYQNRDILLKWILTAVCCVNWFNPAVHWMRRQCFYEMELACDGKVLAARNDEERELYARLMLSFAGSIAGAVSYATGFSGSKKRMRNRIDYVLGSQSKKKGTLLIALTSVTVLLVTSFVSCGYQPEETGEDPSSGVVDGELGSETVLSIPGTRVDELDIDEQHSGYNQLMIIAQKKDIWDQEMDYANESYQYTIIDLDHNGRLEIIVSNMGGTGIYTYNRFYEINESYDDLVECETSFLEDESQPDLLLAEQLETYIDDKGRIFYAVKDEVKNGSAERYQFIGSLSLQSGKVTTVPIASMSCIYQNFVPKETYYNGAGETVTADEYAQATEQYFEGYEHFTTHMGWQDMRELPQDVEGICEKLFQSYDVYCDGPTWSPELKNHGTIDSSGMQEDSEHPSYAGQQYLSQIEKRVAVPGTDICYAMYVVDAALGSRLYGLLKSTDGGMNWYVHSTNPFQNASGGSVEFTFLDESFGFAALSHNGGDEATLYVTEDGGLSYCPVPMLGNPKVTLTDGTQYEPYDYPQMPYYVQDQLVLTVGQGADGDYDGGDRSKLARFISVDHGKTFVFLDYVTSGGKSASDEKISFAGTVFTYEDLIYDISDRVPGVNAILSCTMAGKHIVIDGHIGPKNGAYLLFNTETKQFEDEIFGSNFIWYDDDITTAVYELWNEIYRYDGSLVGTVLMTEGSYLYSLEFAENHSKVRATIMTESGDTEEQLFDI